MVDPLSGLHEEGGPLKTGDRRRSGANLLQLTGGAYMGSYEASQWLQEVAGRVTGLQGSQPRGYF